MNKAKIALVDDDESIQNLFQEFLSQEARYEFHAFSSGKQLLDAFPKLQPDLVLLDIGLPDIDGFKVCSQLRDIATERHLGILFISGQDSKDACIQAYEAGGDDFISKPFKQDELMAKVNRMLASLQNFANLKTQFQYAQKVAFSAMSEASQYGVVLQFIKGLFVCRTYAQLADLLFEAMQKLDLQCCIQMRDEDKQYNFKIDKSHFSPLEVDLFNLLHKQGRIYDFKQRTIYNEQHISILVIRMPMDDPEQYGRIKDIAATLLEAAESCIRDIQKRKLLELAMEDARNIVETVEGKFAQYGKITIDIIDKFLVEMQSGMDSLALTEDQENYFLHMCEKRMENLVNLYVEGQEIDRYFDSLLSKLNTAISEH